MSDARLRAQRARGDLVGARRATDAEVDASGEQRLEGAELLGDHQGRVVRQHDPTGAGADGRGARRDVTDHHGGRGARDARHAVVLGEPVATVAPALGVLRQIERVAERLRGRAALGDGRQVEDRERDHGVNAARVLHGTLAVPAQARAARRRDPGPCADVHAPGWRSRSLLRRLLLTLRLTRIARRRRAALPFDLLALLLLRLRARRLLLVFAARCAPPAPHCHAAGARRLAVHGRLAAAAGVPPGPARAARCRAAGARRLDAHGRLAAAVGAPPGPARADRFRAAGVRRHRAGCARPVAAAAPGAGARPARAARRCVAAPPRPRAAHASVRGCGCSRAARAAASGAAWRCAGTLRSPRAGSPRPFSAARSGPAGRATVARPADGLLGSPTRPTAAGGVVSRAGEATSRCSCCTGALASRAPSPAGGCPPRPGIASRVSAGFAAGAVRPPRSFTAA